MIASGLTAPTALLTDGDGLWVSDRGTGQVLKIARNGEPITPLVVADGLQAPEGLALWRGQVLVREGESGKVYRVTDDGLELLVTLGRGSPPASPAQPPSMVLNDIVVNGDILYGTNELERQIVMVDLGSLVDQ